MKNGYYYATVSEVNVQCYPPPPGANIQGSKSYKYTNDAATNDTVEETNQIVILKSFQATGDNPDYDPNASASGKSSAAPTNTPASVPGEAGIGAMGDGSGSGSGSGSGTGTQSAGSAATGSSGSGGFNQGTGSTGKSEGDKIAVRLGGSVFAVLVAVAAALCL